MAIWLSSRNALERSLSDDNRFWHASRHFWAGALSSALTDLCTFPFDTLKKAMQAEAGSAAPAAVVATGGGGFAAVGVRFGFGGIALGDVARRLRDEGGLLRFYRGYGPRFLLVSINGALFNVTFVVMKARMDRVWPGLVDL